ncbi:MAG: hypothetical protein FWD45_02150 [Coriobacteriia bacterium]|nr:hypothetical protein [Coriobacteriia bacterium]
MKRVSKKTLALVLSLLVALSLTPQSKMAFATGEDAAISFDEVLSSDTNAEKPSSEADKGQADGLSEAADNIETADEGVEGSLETKPEELDVLALTEDTLDVDGGIIPLDINPLDISPLAAFTWNNSTPPSSLASGDIVTIAGTPSGTLTIPAGATITISGSVTGTTAGMTLNIGTGATVIWNASVQGSRSRVADYLITVSGNGTLEVGSCMIANTGTGGALQVTGAGTVISLTNGTVIDSGGASGNSLLISANNVVVNVGSGAVLESQPSNSNAPVLIQNGTLNTNINVNGGTIRSIGSGYAISDGSSFETGTANTSSITLNAGTISSGSASAIRSSGIGSVITVNGGTVSNAATTNVNPTISIIGGTGTNVIINGGTVSATLDTGNGFAIQTTGNVVVNNGTVSAVNGRAINLIGMNSTATVNGGTVRVTGSSASSAAISTATDNPATVTNASITITGGSVSASNGYAINSTGANNTVTISGGTVQSSGSAATLNTSGVNTETDVEDGFINAAGHGNAINASGANATVSVSGGEVRASGNGNAINAGGASAHITIDGGKVHADGSGNAINAMGGVGSTVTITNTRDIVGGSQVSATTGWAVNANGTVTITGGFVFAYGADDSSAISHAYTLNAPAGSGIVVVWKTPTVHTYITSSSTGLEAYPSPEASTLWALGGINYAMLGDTGFFPLDVTVYAYDGLIFNVLNGKFYFDLDGSGNPTVLPNSAPTNEYLPPAGTTSWDPDLKILTLNNFSWNANTEPGSGSAQAALVIYGGPLTIDLASGSTNTFISASRGESVPADGLTGIYVHPTVGTLTISGSGTLIATGGEMHISDNGNSLGILLGADLVINSGTVIASGGEASYASAGIFRLFNSDITVNGGSLVISGSAVSAHTANAASCGIWLFGTTGSFAINGGSLTAHGGSAHSGEFSVSTGILGRLEINGGTTTATSSEGSTSAAFFDGPLSLPVSYIWWTNHGDTDPGGSGALYADGAPSPYNEHYDFHSIPTNRFVRITCGPFAIIEDMVLNGTVGKPLTDDNETDVDRQATLWVFGLHLNSDALDDISDWFAALPAGVTVKVIDAVPLDSPDDNSWVLTLQFEGIPRESSTDIFDITIPATAIKPPTKFALADLHVMTNANARFNIAAVYDLYVNAEAGGTATGSTTGHYTAGSIISVTAIPASGYHFVGWEVSDESLFSDLSAITLSFEMPESRIALTALFAVDTIPTDPPVDNTKPGTDTPRTGDTTYIVIGISMSLMVLGTLCMNGATRRRKLSY